MDYTSAFSFSFLFTIIIALLGIIAFVGLRMRKVADLVLPKLEEIKCNQVDLQEQGLWRLDRIRNNQTAIENAIILLKVDE